MMILKLIKEKIYLSVILCIIFFGLIFSLVHATPSFEVAPKSEPTVAATTVTPSSQLIGGNIVFNSQITDVSGIASAKIDIKSLSGVVVETIILFDDGANSDGAAKDNVFGLQWAVPVYFPIGTYKVFVVASDTFGNTFNSALEQATFNVTTSSLVLSSIVITPNNPSVIVGGTQTFTASPKDQLGNAIAIGTPITWSSSVTTKGTIDPVTGLFTALSSGSTTVTARSGAVTGTVVVTVAPQVLTAIDITPASPTIAAGATQLFTAVAKDQVGKPMPATIAWTSSAPLKGTIVSYTGFFNALTPGTTVVTATSGTVTSSTTVTINTASLVLTTIVVTPANPSIVVGATQTFTAEAKDQFGNPFAAAFTWTSSAPVTGTITPGADLFTALAAGTTTITAKSGSITGSSSVIVANSLSLTSTITSPNDGAEFKIGDLINFNSTVTGGVAPYTYSWKSTYSAGSPSFPGSMDGVIGNLSTFTRNDLIANMYARDITLTVRDDLGATATSVVKIYVYFPNAIIQGITNGQTFTQIIDSIKFDAVACGSKTPCTYTWLSSINGNIGNLQTIERNDLAIGSHTIRLKVSDAWGQTNTTTVNINVVAATSLMSKISSPTVDFAPIGSSVTFTALVAGGPAPYIYEWTSDLQGPIGSTSTFSKTDLIGGQHVITLKITDAASNTVTKTMVLNIITCTDLVNNGPSSNKLDIVFVSSNYGLGQMTQFVTDVTASKDKLFSIEPFMAQQSKVNIHYVSYAGDLGCYLDAGNLHCDAGKAMTLAAACPSDQVGVMTTLAGNGKALPNSGIFYVSQVPWLVVHDIGHTFGGLEDEYDYGYTSGGTPLSSVPNCDKAGCPKWNTIAGTTCDLGCSFSNWRRSSPDSIMRSSTADYFNTVSIKRLQSRLSVYP